MYQAIRGVKYLWQLSRLQKSTFEMSTPFLEFKMDFAEACSHEHRRNLRYAIFIVQPISQIMKSLKTLYSKKLLAGIQDLEWDLRTPATMGSNESSDI